MGISLYIAGGIIGGILIVIIINMYCEKALRLRAIEKGWAYHDSNNGKFVWINEDAEYVINGVSHTSNDEKPSVFRLKGIMVGEKKNE